MSLRPGADKRGPKLGDAASLWNFTPSPGWTKEEAQILRLCLMKFGVGKWVQILDTGLLPGKLIQQLNGQTQRLLGQQSLAAYTGLQVNLDRIRADNELRKDVERKSGLIINSGPNPTKKLREQWQMEAKAKYGLTASEVQEAEQALEEVAAAIHHVGSTGAATSAPTSHLIDADASALSKEEKVQLLKRLRAKLHALVLQATTPLPAAAAVVCRDTVVEASGSSELDSSVPSADAPLQRAGTSGSDEVMQDAARQVARPLGKAAAKASKPKPAAKRKPAPKADGSQTKRKRGKKANASADALDAMALEEPDADSRMAASAAAVGLEADLAQLQAMGFSKEKAKEALEEASFDVEAAIEWLVANCI